MIFAWRRLANGLDGAVSGAFPLSGALTAAAKGLELAGAAKAGVCPACGAKLGKNGLGLASAWGLVKIEAGAAEVCVSAAGVAIAPN